MSNINTIFYEGNEKIIFAINKPIRSHVEEAHKMSIQTSILQFRLLCKALFVETF